MHCKLGSLLYNFLDMLLEIARNAIYARYARKIYF